tara:strand:+ start:329 stop:502 length:174 start_codon:yes stop_codon:yes gene_type:complete
MENNYTIEEILLAVDDLQKIKKKKITKAFKEINLKPDNSNIPKDTLRLIEQAEKAKN